MLVKFKKLHKDAILPAYAKDGDAGLDLWAVDVQLTNNYVECFTGIATEIPLGYVGLLFPRSSISHYTMSLANSVGVLDSGYRGEITFRFRYKDGGSTYTLGDKVGQLVILPYPTITPLWAKELESSVRGTSGYGSTGK